MDWIVPRIATAIVLAGCPGAAPPAPPVAAPRPEPAPACPAAADLRQVRYDVDHGWVLPLGMRFAELADDAKERALTADEVARLVPTTPLWLLRPGEPPCATTYGPAFAVPYTDGLINESFQVEVRGCPPRPRDDHPFAVGALGPRTVGCEVVTDAVVSIRATWDQPAKTPIPRELAAVLTPPCQPPCTPLWRITAASVGSTAIAWDTLQTSLTVGPGDDCGWPSADDADIFVRTVAGPRSLSKLVTNPEADLLTQVEHLHAVLAVGVEPTAVIVTNLGEYMTYELAAGQARIAHHLRWYQPHDEAYESDGSLGPYCGP